MKQPNIIIFLAFALLLLLILNTLSYGADQKYEVNFKLKYNAVTADELNEILQHLEKLKGKHRKDPIQIEPCVWEIKVEGTAGTDGHTIQFSEATTGLHYTSPQEFLYDSDAYPKYKVDDDGRAWVDKGVGWNLFDINLNVLGSYTQSVTLHTEDGIEYKWNRETERWVRR